MRRALDWLVVDALGRVACVDQPGLPLASDSGALAERSVAANDAFVRESQVRCTDVLVRNAQG